MRYSRRGGAFLPVVLGVSLGIGGSGCGSGYSSPTPVPTPTPTPTPAPSPLPTFAFTGIAQNQAVFTDVSVSAPSVLAATADWTFANDDIDIVYTDTSCSRSDARTIVQGFCSVQARTNSFSKPERLSANVGVGTVRVYVLNFGPGTESGTVQLTLQRQ
jgi:hypothetical protein